ncbi:MAG: TetR/AcrR family transcriptional regulator [Deltaproteobacteria bacterium]|nr:MAG: TetR/AcrR family transcriptional regulator [Deltaproteobacteria bacterium]
MGKGADTRGMILDRALSLASTEGLEQLTIGLLAKAVGMSKSGLFAHFKSKEQLQLSVLEAASERFVRGVISPSLKEPRGEPRVQALFDHWLEWEAAFPGGCPYQTAIIEFDDRPGVVRDYLLETQRDWQDALTQAARIAVDEGHFRADLEPKTFAFQFTCLAIGYYQHKHLYRDGTSKTLTRKAFDQLLDSARA